MRLRPARTPAWYPALGSGDGSGPEASFPGAFPPMEAKEHDMTHPTRPTDLHRAAVDLATDVAAVLVDRAGSLPADEAYRLGMEGVRTAERLLRAAAADSAREAAEAFEAARLGAARIVVALDRLAALYPLPEEAAQVSRRAGRLAHAIAEVRDEYRLPGEGA
jgi:hypothetical protein